MGLAFGSDNIQIDVCFPRLPSKMHMSSFVDVNTHAKIYMNRGIRTQACIHTHTWTHMVPNETMEFVDVHLL